MANDIRATKLDLMVPAIIAQTHLDYAVEQGIDVRALMREAGVRMDDTASVSAGIPMAVFERVIDLVFEKLGDDRVGFEVGWRLPPTAFGSVGQAMLASATVGDALQVCQRFWPLIGRGVSPRVSFENEQCVLDFVPVLPVPERFRRMMLESTVVGVYRALGIVAPQALPQCEVWLDFPAPSYIAIVREKIPAVRYDMPASQVRSPIAMMDWPLAMANAPGLRVAIEQCERELAVLQLPNALTARVQQELRLGKAGYPDLNAMAERLHLSTRTLRRRLQEEGTQFSALLDDARRRDAVHLLGNGELDIQRVAALLGYADPANFTRAFRKWTGKTPSDFRTR